LPLSKGKQKKMARPRRLRFVLCTSGVVASLYYRCFNARTRKNARRRTFVRFLDVLHTLTLARRTQGPGSALGLGMLCVALNERFRPSE
jgi:hypothetical protein